MKDKNSQKLQDDFPELYFYLQFGCECGDGWFNIIYDLSKALYEGCKDKGIAMGACDEECCFYITQVKEKYGTLRFYTSLTYDWMDNLIDNAEIATETICEVCGKEGSFRKGSWITVRCDECFKT